MVNGRLQGHLRERVQLSLAQSLNKDTGGRLERRVCQGGRAVGGEAPCGFPGLRDPVTQMRGRRLQVLAWFTSSFLKIFVFFLPYFTEAHCVLSAHERGARVPALEFCSQAHSSVVALDCANWERQRGRVLRS